MKLKLTQRAIGLDILGVSVVDILRDETEYPLSHKEPKPRTAGH